MSAISDRFSKRQILFTLGISIFFIATYFLLRALPNAQCGFLHYEEVVNADGQVEFCATNHAGFLDLSVLKYPVQMKLETDTALEIGVEQEVALELETSGGMPIAAHELAITHTEKMHVMLVDPSLQDYHHVHPEPVDLNGLYRFQFTPQEAGEYVVYTEVVPLRSRRQVIAAGALCVSGATQAPDFTNSQTIEINGLHFALSGVPERLRTGRDYRFSLDVDDAEGMPAALESIMGARGHMVAFDSERRGFAHMHPIASVLGEESNTEAALSFLFNVPNPGWYRLFAQVQVGGREVFGRFDLLVE
jgi:hypothetical protein